MADRLEHLRIYFVTWNVATKYPEQNLYQLLDVTHSNSSRTLPDLYFIGLQEVKAQPQNMVLDMFFEDPWTKSFREILKQYDYVKIRTQRLQGLVLNGFCLRKHITHLRSIEAQYTKTGFKGMWGNKGAVSIRLNIYGVSMCIVNTHLTPHDHLLADRIIDYNTILTNHSFTCSDTSKILYHDYVFWIGDLNFRLIENDLSATEIDLMVKRNQLKCLLEKDQLKSVMKNGEAFAELNENAITFPPTYKYEFASQEFDLKRRPSWTDRILYKVNADVYDDVKLNAIQQNYKSHSNYIQSDHKPVTGEFDIVVRPGVPDHGVEFQPVSQWFIDEENSVSYRLLGDAKRASGDWVGLFHNEFSSLDEYIVYEYVGRGKASPIPFEPHAITERIYFSDTAIRAPGIYRLVYVAQEGNLVGILGVSPPFPGYHRLG
ncbi:inositol polyphosphate 5-phosphatase K-like isoform X2 [Hylaeus anthracinus]|uniref:inositol polyphosphate 5-phosphatase K-like isoform X2 n=1 Tax=Hylaeus volcanicus TaxID=313075 RepID=UPI0023B7B15F|nr:inositol polyphosphate 5-phosphatase K-like isoform X2 [Hylaeus volcanicus]XP_054007608.1 inositol polyphosphate 5-phosphatase K-like isoform X2 [Hylaeus anthracinus]